MLAANFCFVGSALWCICSLISGEGIEDRFVDRLPWLSNFIEMSHSAYISVSDISVCDPNWASLLFCSFSHQGSYKRKERSRMFSTKI